MSEITANLFQFSKRANTINVNQEEMPDFNDKINEISVIHGVQFENFKDLFKFLIDLAIQENKIPENQTDLLAEIENLKANHERELNQARENYSVHFERAESLDQQLKQLQDDQFKKELDKSLEMENVLLVPCTPEQKELLEGIAKNRLDADYETVVPGEPDSAAEIVKQMVFRKGYLYNHYGIFYTGL